MADTMNTLAPMSVPAEVAEFGLPSHTAVGAAATGANTATLTATTGKQWLGFACVVSFGATIASACTLTITDGVGGTVLFQAEIPTIASPAPISFDFTKRPLHSATGNAMQAALSTPGAIKSAITLTGKLVLPP